MSKNDRNCDVIAQRLRILRAEYKLTQLDVAKKLGVSQQTYSKYENKSANLDSATIVKLCELFGVSSDYLLGIDTVPKIGTIKKISVEEPAGDEIKMIVKQVLKELKNSKRN